MIFGVEMKMCYVIIVMYTGGSAVQPLPWDLRIKIIIGAARGIAFLHSSDDRVIYRDIKASNILLDGVSSPDLVKIRLLLLVELTF